MKFNAEDLMNDKSSILSIENKDLSYSPMYSNIGLVSANDYCGIEALYLHYNRTSRAIWSPFIVFEDGFSRISSSVCCLSFRKGNKKATIAFYGKDRFVVETENTESFSICTETADSAEEMWVESMAGDCVILRGYSVNRDARDPDRLVPYMAGVKVLKGNLVEEDCRITVRADKEGKILAAFALEVLEISEASILKMLEEAPKSAWAAERNTGEWFRECLDGFTADVGSEREKSLLARTVTGLLFNETMGQGNLKGHVSSYPSRGTYPTHYLWDSCFQNLALEEMNTRLAKDALLLFAKCQRADGKYEQFLCSTWSRPHEAQPALIGWAVMRIVEKSGEEDRKFAEMMFRSLERNNNWWLHQRMTRYGVIYCPHGLETGQDDSPRFDQGPILAVDMNSYLLSQMRATARLARILHIEDEAAAWDKKADFLAENMIKVLYDSRLNMFFDADPRTGERRSLWSASGFLPLWAEVGIEKEKANEMIKTHMLDKKRFFGKIPFPCIAYDQDEYQPEKWWRGPTWMSLAWLMVETLQKYGFWAEHEHVCRTYYRMLLEDGRSRELFHSQTGEGLGAYDQGWTASVFIKLNRILYEGRTKMRVLNEDRLREQVKATILADIEKGKVGGVAVAVTQEGKTIYQECFGDEKIGISVSENTLFRMASMTKPITAIAILILVDRGKLNLDDPVADFIPAFKDMFIGRMNGDEVECVEPAKTLITIRQLLTHSSGLGSGPVGDRISAKLPVKERTSLSRVVDYYARNPLDFEPSSSQFYSGIHGFDVLARIVEIVSGMDYDKFLEKELFTPLGMKDTTFTPKTEQWKRMIPMHTNENGVSSIADFPENSVFEGFPTTYFAGGAGLASTIEDYKKFADMLLNYGKYEGGQIVSEERIKEMSTPQLPTTIMGGSEVWGLGVRVIKDELYQHLPSGTFGWSGAYGTHFWVDPSNKITAIYLKNSLYDGGSGASTARRFELDVKSAIEK